MTETVSKFYSQTQTVQNNGSVDFDLGNLGPQYSYVYGISGADWTFANQLVNFGVSLSAVENDSVVTVSVTFEGELSEPANTAITLLATTVADGSISLCVQNPAEVLTSAQPQVNVLPYPYQAAGILAGFSLGASAASVCAGIGAAAGAASVVNAEGISTLQMVNWGLLLPRSATFLSTASTITSGLIASAESPELSGLSLAAASGNLTYGLSSDVSVTIPGASTFGNPQVVALLSGFAGVGPEPGNIAIVYGMSAQLTNLAVSSAGVATGTLTFSLSSGTNSFGYPGVQFVLVCYDASLTI